MITLIPQRSRIALDVTLALLAVIFVSLRFAIRYRHYSLHKRRRQRPTIPYILGDVFVGCALVLCIVYASADILLQTKPHIQKPQTKEDLALWIRLREHAAKTTALDYVIGTIGQFMVKGAFLCYYWDAREGLGRRLRATLWGMTGFIIALFMTLLGYVVGKCVPFSNYWVMNKDNCLINHPRRDSLMFSLIHIIADLAIMIMGLLVIRSLRVHLQRRIIPALAFIFLLGFLTISMNCVRLGVGYPLIRALRDQSKILGNGEAEKLSEWTLVVSLADFSTALIAASLPSIRVMGRRWFGDEGNRAEEPGGSPIALPAFMTEVGADGNRRSGVPGDGESAAALGMLEMGEVRTSSIGSRESSFSGLSEVRSQERKFSWSHGKFDGVEVEESPASTFGLHHQRTFSGSRIAAAGTPGIALSTLGDERSGEKERKSSEV